MSGKALDFYVGVKKILDDWSDEFKAKVNEAADVASRDAVKKLKATSPRDSGDYAKGWTRKKTKTDFYSGYTVYNKDKPGLTHLLEFGHALSNQFGSLGKRVPAHQHIKKVEQEAAKEFEELIGL